MFNWGFFILRSRLRWFRASAGSATTKAGRRPKQFYQEKFAAPAYGFTGTGSDCQPCFVEVTSKYPEFLSRNKGISHW
jgi:hypothetical protein